VSKIAVYPVVRRNWDDFTRLFEARGAPHYCFCTPYRFSGVAGLTKKRKKSKMRHFVTEGTPIGVLAYDGDEPVGWCSIAPRETYVRLERSKTMARKTPLGTPTWTVSCFFVARSHRHQGVTRALLEGAVRYAKKLGARVVEGYPFDTASITATHRGHSSVFEAVRFRRDGARWVRELTTR
jgi:GNAT superfamily N-acetyltransferase